MLALAEEKEVLGAISVPSHRAECFETATQSAGCAARRDKELKPTLEDEFSAAYLWLKH
jgi:hypothetical protein